MAKKNSKAVELLIKVHSTNEDCMTSRFAILSLTPTVIKCILSLKKELEGVQERLGKENIYQLTQFNYNCNFVSEEERTFSDEKENSEKFIEKLEEVLGEQSYVTICLTKKERENTVLIRQDVSILHVSDFGFKFSCYIKHTSTKLDTETISFETLTGGLNNE